MMTRTDIDQKYIDQANQLEADFFEIVDNGSLGQHRVLREGKSIEDFNLQHRGIWQNHEAECIANGFMEPIIEPVPNRDLAAEIDEIKVELEKLKSKVK